MAGCFDPSAGAGWDDGFGLDLFLVKGTDVLHVRVIEKDPGIAQGQLSGIAGIGAAGVRTVVAIDMKQAKTHILLPQLRQDQPGIAFVEIKTVFKCMLKVIRHRARIGMHADIDTMQLDAVRQRQQRRVSAIQPDFQHPVTDTAGGGQVAAFG